MGEASWRMWCWWRVYLAVVVVVTAAAAAAAAAGTAGQQAHCEVLDSDLQSTFTLPTNLTLRPLKREWQLHFALQQTNPPSIACVSVNHYQKISGVKFKLYGGTCSEGPMLDYGFMKDVVVGSTAWTLLQVKVRNNTVVVEPSGAPTVVLRGRDAPLPRDILQVVATHDVEAAVGCRVSCPHYNHSSRRGKKKNVLMTRQKDVLFYFRPGDNFVRLQHEVACITTLGNTFYPHVADIKPSPGHWHVLEVRHHGDVAQVWLDYELQQSRDLLHQCAFKEHIVRIDGQGLFSFSCNPASGLLENNDVPQWSGNAWSVMDHTVTTSIVVAVTIVLVVGFNLVL